MRLATLKTIQRTDSSGQVLSADVCVLGAGAAGLSAALEAQALGLSVILADASHQIGGQAVGSAIGTICGLYENGADPRRITHGVMDAMLNDLIHGGHASPRRARNTVILDYSLNAWQRWAETALAERGITPLFGATLRTVRREGAVVERLEFATRFGDVQVSADSFIDASGDGVIPWLSDLPMTTSAEPIYGTVMAVLEGVDGQACDAIAREAYHDALKRYAEEFDLIRQDGFVFRLGKSDKALLNMTHIAVPTDATALSLAGIEGRRQVDAVLAMFKREFPAAFSHANVHVYGQPGIRQTRSIVGRHTITADEIRNGHRPDDALVRCSWPIELHTDLADVHWEVFGDEHMHYVPMSAMTPVGLDNVVAAGRCISADPVALASVRVIGACFSMGRAAANMIFLRDGKSVHDVAIDGLQDTLEDNLHGGTSDRWVTQLSVPA